MQYTHASNIGAKPIHYGAVVDMISSKYLNRETLFTSCFWLSIICLLWCMVIQREFIWDIRNKDYFFPISWKINLMWSTLQQKSLIFIYQLSIVNQMSSHFVVHWQQSSSKWFCAIVKEFYGRGTKTPWP